MEGIERKDRGQELDGMDSVDSDGLGGWGNG